MASQGYSLSSPSSSCSSSSHSLSPPFISLVPPSFTLSGSLISNSSSAFNRGPLDSKPPLPFLTFISIALLPINPKHVSDPDPVPVPSHKPILLTFKALILAVIVGAYRYEDNLHPNVILGFYCCHVYLGVELILAMTAFLVPFFLGFGFEIEPQFNEPYLATSLQDFWGRRWNLMVTSILRPTVYDPIRQISTPILGRLLGRLPAIFAAFLVSGPMHELIYFYLTRVWPTWEVTWFFVLHGVCTALEVAVKKVVNGRFQLHRAVSGPLTVAFAADIEERCRCQGQKRIFDFG